MTLDYDKFASFEHAVLSDLYRKLHARTNLSMAEVIALALATSIITHSHTSIITHSHTSIITLPFTHLHVSSPP